MSVIADVKNLTHVAISLQCRGIFDIKLTINGYLKQHRIINNFLHSYDK